MKKLIIKIGNEIHELPYNGEVFSFEISEKYVPKAGDCVRVIENYLRCENFFKIVSIDDDGDVRAESSVNLDKEKCTIDLGALVFLCETEFTQITPEELKAKYAEAGYDWDYETNEVKPIKWMPKEGDKVWALNGLLEPYSFTYSSIDRYILELKEKGFLFPTKEKCKEFSDHCLKYFDKK